MKRVQFPRLGEVCCETVLDNGLKIQVVPRPGYLKSYAFFATSYGGMNVRFRKDGVWQETPAGVAHFLEHKMAMPCKSSPPTAPLLTPLRRRP